MALFSFFRSERPKQFNFTPRYYDERKEALQERIKNIEIEMGVRKDDGARRRLQKGALQEHFTKKRTAERKSSLRLVFITALLLAVFYYLFYK